MSTRSSDVSRDVCKLEISESDDENDLAGEPKKARSSSSLWGGTSDGEQLLPSDDDGSSCKEQAELLFDVGTSSDIEPASTPSMKSWGNSSEDDNVYNFHIECDIAEAPAETEQRTSPTFSPFEDEIYKSELSELADVSGDAVSTSNDDVQEIKYSRCIMCKKSSDNKTPFIYCDGCYRTKKSRLSKIRRKRTTRLPIKSEKAASIKSVVEDSTICNLRKSPLNLINSSECPGPMCEQSTEDNLCSLCTINPRNGIFVHGSNAHICCCYECAKKAWCAGKRCIICKKRVTQVLKAYYYN